MRRIAQPGPEGPIARFPRAEAGVPAAGLSGRLDRCGSAVLGRPSRQVDSESADQAGISICTLTEAGGIDFAKSKASTLRSKANRSVMSGFTSIFPVAIIATARG